MNISGIIAEFNPLHNGHKHLIERVKEENDGIICVMSGNFVQRGDIAVVSKFDRAKMAINSGIDLCVELPTPWAMATAQTFAGGAVNILHRLNIVDKIYFGSESADIELLKKASALTTDKNFIDTITSQLKNGTTFAAARQTVAERINPDTARILNSPNDILGIEYISALSRENSLIEPVCIKRQGVDHDSLSPEGSFLSASQIRKKVAEENFDALIPFMPENCLSILKDSNLADLSRIEKDILGKLRRTSAKCYKELPDISEGIENRLMGAARSAVSLDEIYSLIKTKRYTMSRVRRLVLSAYLDLKAEYTLSPVPYARVLGFSKKGEEIIKELKNKTQIPLVMRAGDIDKLDDQAKKIFNAETVATDLYALSLKNPLPCGTEYTQKIIKGE